MYHARLRWPYFPNCALLCCVAALYCAALLLCCAVQLVDEAYSRWLEEEDGVVDDITAVVVKLHMKEQ
jgi:hypothetical protein